MLTVAPLREHLEDLPLLVREMIARYNRQFNKTIARISPECIRILEAYDWPVNVRELKNVIQRAVWVCEDETILPEHLPPRFRTGKDRRPTISFEIGTPLDQVEKMVWKALAIAENNHTKAAELLGISRRAIYNKLKKHNIE